MTKYASVLDVDHITSVIARRCDSHGIALEWSESHSVPMTNRTRMILPQIYQPVSAEAMTKLYGHVIHECGHHLRPEAFSILENLDAPTAVAAIFNIVEDDGMERQVARSYHGDAKALGEQNSLILNEIGDKWHEESANWPTDLNEQDVAPLAVTGLAQLSRISWDLWSNNTRHKFMNNLHPVAKKLLDDLVSEGWVERFEQTQTTSDCWDTAIDLTKRLYPDADDEQMEQLRQDGHEAMEGNEDGKTDDQGQDQPGSKGDTGEGEANDEQSQCNGQPAPLALADDNGRLPGEGETIHWKDAVLSEHNEWKPKDPNSPPGNIGIDWTDYQSGEVGLAPQKDINVVDLGKRSKERPERNTRYLGRCGSPSSFMPDNRESRAFANQIRRYIQAQKRTKYDPEKYHGELDKRGIIRLALPPIDGGDWNRKIFHQMRSDPAKDTCIHILTDWSGSMSGKKMVYAADASGRLVQVFDRILRMPVQLAAFTNGRTRCDIGLIKKFDERSVAPIDIATGFSRFYKFSSANNDADALMWAYNQTRKRKEERKIIIVLSDGCPAGTWTWRASSHSNLRHVTDHIHRDKEVELYGVGICSNAVENYYENCKVLNDPSEINRTLFEIIKEGAKRERHRQ